jgi:ABC-type branched-subunit amino acid transport system substrate-binding protein
MIFGRAGNLIRFAMLTLTVSLSIVASARSGELIVGMSAAFKGPSRGLSIELYRGSSAFFEHINSSGGVHGNRIMIRPYDDGYEPIPAIENTIRLVEQDHAFLLFDYMGTPTTARVLPLLKKYYDSGQPVYLFCPFTGGQPTRQYPYGDFVFNLRASYQEETGTLVDRFMKIGRRRIAVFYQIDAYGRSGWDGVRRQLASYDLNGKKLASEDTRPEQERMRMVGEATYRRGTNFAEGMRPQLELLHAAKPDAVISVGTYSACAALVREARDAGWDVPIANVSGVDSENMLKLLLDAGRQNGKDYTKNLINSEVVPNYNDLTLPAVVEYRELMDRYHPKPPAELLNEPYEAPKYSFISFEGMLNAKLLVRMLEKLGPAPDRKRIKEVAESLDPCDLGIDVPASFGVRRHQGLRRVYCATVAGDRFVPLADADWQRFKP